MFISLRNLLGLRYGREERRGEAERSARGETRAKNGEKRTEEEETVGRISPGRSSGYPEADACSDVGDGGNPCGRWCILEECSCGLRQD